MTGAEARQHDKAHPHASHGRQGARVTAYVLGLPDQFRGDQLIERLTGFGIPTMRVSAVDAAALRPSQVATFYDASAARWIERELTPAEAACAHGHLTMMREFLRSDAEWGLFLEDDAILLRDPVGLLDVLPVAPATPVAVHLNAALADAERPRLVRQTADCRIWEVSKAPDRTVGYLANRALAHLATSRYESHRVDSVADWPVRWRYDARFALVDPAFVDHSGLDSSIEADRAVAQDAGVRDRPTRLRRLFATLAGLDLRHGRTEGYPATLVFRLNVAAPVAEATRRRGHLASRRFLRRGV